jgi:hypothetical protein
MGNWLEKPADVELPGFGCMGFAIFWVSRDLAHVSTAQNCGSFNRHAGKSPVERRRNRRQNAKLREFVFVHDVSASAQPCCRRALRQGVCPPVPKAAPSRSAGISRAQKCGTIPRKCGSRTRNFGTFPQNCGSSS